MIYLLTHFVLKDVGKKILQTSFEKFCIFDVPIAVQNDILSDRHRNTFKAGWRGKI